MKAGDLTIKSKIYYVDRKDYKIIEAPIKNLSMSGVIVSIKVDRVLFPIDIHFMEEMNQNLSIYLNYDDAYKCLKSVIKNDISKHNEKLEKLKLLLDNM